MSFVLMHYPAKVSCCFLPCFFQQVCSLFFMFIMEKAKKKFSHAAYFGEMEMGARERGVFGRTLKLHCLPFGLVEYLAVCIPAYGPSLIFYAIFMHRHTKRIACLVKPLDVAAQWRHILWLLFRYNPGSRHGHNLANLTLSTGSRLSDNSP